MRRHTLSGHIADHSDSESSASLQSSHGMYVGIRLNSRLSTSPTVLLQPKSVEVVHTNAQNHLDLLRTARLLTVVRFALVVFVITVESDPSAHSVWSVSTDA